jgi:PAS domain S-box-containing protein
MSESPLRVLLIDDDEDYFVIVRDLLAEARDLHVELTWVDSFDKGLEALGQNHTDVFIVDYRLGAHTGLELVQEAVARKVASPFILLTGQGDQEIAVEAMKAGVVDYLIKGQVDVPLLEHALRHAVETARSRQLVRRMVEILENTNDLVATCNVAGGLLYLNAAGRQLLGIGADEDPSRLSIQQFHPAGPAAESLSRALVVADREGSWNGETKLLSRTGRQIPVLQTIVAHKAADGRTEYYSFTAHDIADRKCAEELLQQTNQRLREALDELKSAETKVIQQERLRALGTMASGIAHDINNALAAIVGFSELLLHRPETLDDRERTLHYLKALHTTACDAGNVVNRLREFYRHREEGAQGGPVNVNQLVQECVALTQPRWMNETQAKGITIDVRTDLQEVPDIVGNEPELREALANLIFNAVDAMPRGGTMTLRTRWERNQVLIEVADTGTGMTEEVRRRCLEPFFSTKGQRGTGLGLATAYGTISRHRGRIDIQTELGKGTVFLIRLPAQPARPGADAATAGGSPAPSRSLRILTVDDETVLREVIAEYLASDGHNVETAGSGREALEKFENAEFDLMLIDRAMPGMSGDQLAAAVRAKNSTVPIIMLTGFGSMMIAGEEKPPGVDMVVGKPVTMAQLRQAIAKVTA